jgi:hypothetical protein
MNMKPVTIFLAGVVLAASPAFAAPQWVEDACWRAANRVLPRLSAREKEAYITNCIADWTAGTPPPTGSNTNRNRY